ncbi:MAG: aminotransferase class V-fold PLP-dependent enzyme [Gemmatimonadaceae bacterium]|nr:aminotransferase class V-fold PLP-dependent enzyme [Gemmatimonadaceae bacterium]
MPIDVTAIREREFPWTARGDAIFLDHASTGPLPERTRRALAEHGLRRAEPFRLTADDFFPTLQRARDAAAALIGAPPGTVALMTNTSHGVNLAARALPYGRGEVILSTAGEFPANVYPWIAAARERGADFRMLPLANGFPDEAAILHAIESDPRVRGVAVSWVSFWNGYRFDLDALGAACRRHGKWLFVDAIQGVGASDLDVVRANVDVLACGGQKWLLSPWGTGFCYVRKELVTSLEPKEVGWMAQPATSDFNRFLEYDPTWFDDARRFEVVTLDFVNFAAMAASLSLFLELTQAAVGARVRALVERAVAFASANEGVELMSAADPAHRAGVVALRPRDVAAASGRLKDAGLAHAVREGNIRIAPHFYNTEAELDGALRLLSG